MTNYVAGFLFSPDFYHVVLIEKQKPKWQKGLYNGVGGKIELGETAVVAMQREFYEEAFIHVDNWKEFCHIEGKDYTVQFFYGISNQYDEVKSRTDEQVFHLPVHDLRLDHIYHKLIPNLNWLIPLAIDVHNGYSGDIIVQGTGRLT